MAKTYKGVDQNTLTGVAQNRGPMATGKIYSPDPAVQALDRTGSTGIPSWMKDVMPNVNVASQFNRDHPGLYVSKAKGYLQDTQQAAANQKEGFMGKQLREGDSPRYAALQRAFLGDQATRAGTVGKTAEYQAGFDAEAKARAGGSKKGIQAANSAYEMALQQALGMPVSGLPARQVK